MHFVVLLRPDSACLLSCCCNSAASARHDTTPLFTVACQGCWLWCVTGNNAEVLLVDHKQLDLPGCFAFLVSRLVSCPISVSAPISFCFMAADSTAASVLQPKPASSQLPVQEPATCSGQIPPPHLCTRGDQPHYPLQLLCAVMHHTAAVPSLFEVSPFFSRGQPVHTTVAAHSCSVQSCTTQLQCLLFV